MTEHSAAQWKVGEFAEWGGYDCMTSEIRVGPARLDGEAYGQDTCVPATPEMIERMKADARLIGAAHEMLDALRELHSLCKAALMSKDGEQFNSFRTHSNTLIHAAPSMNKAKEVLEKVTGRRY